LNFGPRSRHAPHHHVDPAVDASDTDSMEFGRASPEPPRCRSPISRQPFQVLPTPNRRPWSLMQRWRPPRCPHQPRRSHPTAPP
jgi:hypothetical protein